MQIPWFKAETEHKERAAWFGCKPFLSTVQSLLSTHHKNPAFMCGKLILNWQDIIGADIASIAYPQTIKKSVLRLKASNSAKLLLAYQKESIIDRINTYFGHALIEDIYFTYGKVSPPSVKPTPKEAPITIEPTAQTLEEALTALGKTVRKMRLRRRLHPASKSS